MMINNADDTNLVVATKSIAELEKKNNKTF